ncbi:MAG: PQQ-like beta-propeller repeat protein [Planctomycetaceae bacterium]|nr:PQQ-like beta-propeller repeat protein [Planctomycetaceae bacterium]
MNRYRVIMIVAVLCAAAGGQEVPPPPPREPAVAQACDRALQIATAQQYDQIEPFIKQIEQAAAGNGKLLSAVGELYAWFGHNKLASETFTKAKDPKSLDFSASRRGVIADVPREAEMEMRCDAIRALGAETAASSALQPREAQDLLDQTLTKYSCLRLNETHFSSAWYACDQSLNAMPAARLEGIRSEQDLQARNRAVQAARSGDFDQALRLFRRYPWAASVHEALLDLGELAVRQHRLHWAAAAARDVLTHAAMAQAGKPAPPEAGNDLRGRAQVLLWLTMVQTPQGRVELSGTAVNDAALPWRGGTASAAQIKAALLKQSPQSQTAGPSPVLAVTLPAGWTSLGRRSDEGVELSLHVAWPVSWAQDTPRGLLVGCAGSIALLSQGSQPLWSRTPAPPAAMKDWGPASQDWRLAYDRQGASGLGVHAPVVTTITAAGSRTRTVACQFEDQQAPEAITVCDLADGAVLWTTRDRPDWQKMRPLCRPLAADGRVFVLATEMKEPPHFWRVHERAGVLNAAGAGDSPLLLVGLDAADGRILFKHVLGTATDPVAELIRSGCGMSIFDGAVYCSTNGGFVARADCRDGMIAWIKGYPQAFQAAKPPIQYSREGGGPIVVGRAVLTAPRDHSGVVAFDRDSGNLLWERPMVPSDRLAGVSGSVLITANTRWLAGIDIASGRMLWCRKLPAAIVSQAGIAGDNVQVICQDKLLQFAAATGAPAGESAIDAATAEPVFLGDQRLAMVTVPPLPAPKEAKTPSRPLQAPLQEVLNLPLAQSQIFVPAPHETTAPVAAVLTDRLLTCIRTNPTIEVAWQRLLPARPGKGTIIGKNVLLVTGSNVAAFDAAGGKPAWSVDLPFNPEKLDGDDKAVFATTDAAGATAWAAMIDPAAGRVLWSRNLSAEGFTTDKNAHKGFFRRQGEGPATVGMVLSKPAGKDVQYCEVLLNGASGAVAGAAPLAVGEPCQHNTIAAGRDWAFFQDKETVLHIIRRGGAGADWGEKLPMRWIPYDTYEIYAMAEGPYYRHQGQILHYNVAANRSVTYPPGGKPWGVHSILNFRRQGNTLAVVSSIRIAILHRSLKWREIRKPSEMWLDVYEADSGKLLYHTTLGGVSCWDTSWYKYNPSGGVLDNAVIGADSNSVRVFTGAK